MKVTDLKMEDLVDRFYEGLYRFALSLSRNESVAADLTQETYYLWAAKGHQLRDASKVKSWLFTTLHREFLGRQRHESRFPHFETSEVEHEMPSLNPEVVNQMDGHLVMESLQQVEETYRVPLALFYLEELSYKEIAEALDLPIGTVMSRLSRGKTQLRELLNDAIHREESKIVKFTAPRANRA